MAITVQALQADGTWAVRSAFVTENKEVVAGSMKAADLEAKARSMMAKWQTMQDGKQMRVHNSANDPKPATRKVYGAWNITEQEYQAALTLSTGDGPLAEAAYQLVRYCRGEIFYRDQAAEAGRMIRESLAA